MLCYQACRRKRSLVSLQKKAGDVFKKGDILGEVRDYEGNMKEMSIAEYDGVILYQCSTLQVLQNGPMITYGRIISPYDERKERIVNYWEKRSDSFLEQETSGTSQHHG